jgi:hypothetical protein
MSDSQSALGRGGAPNKSAASIGSAGSTLTTSLLHKGGSLAIALQASRRSSSTTSTRTSFVRSSTTTGSGSTEASSSFQKCIAFNHVVFHASTNSNSRSQMSKHSKSATSRLGAATSRPSSVSAGMASAASTNKRSASLFSHLAVAGFQKKPRTR